MMAMIPGFGMKKYDYDDDEDDIDDYFGDDDAPVQKTRRESPLQKMKASQELDEDNTNKIIIVCSNCNKPLVEIWVIRPNAPIKSEIVAKCCHCGDKSFKMSVAGQYCIGNLESGVTKLADITTDMKEVNGQLIQYVTIETEKG